MDHFSQVDTFRNLNLKIDLIDVVEAELGIDPVTSKTVINIEFIVSFNQNKKIE